MEKINEEKLTETQIKEIIKNNTEELMNIIKDGKNSEEEMKAILNEKMTKMQEETQKLLQEEITKIDYTEQISQMNEMLTNLKDSYLELSNKLMKQEAEKEYEEIVMENEVDNSLNKGKNIIDFLALKKQKNKKKKVYSIDEDIAYEDLEGTAAYVIPLENKKVI